MKIEEVSVLDHGFVRLVEHMGGDRGVVQAARVSFGQGLKTEEQDRKLIKFLLVNNHLSPFEHSIFKFHVKLPIFVARQWFRHRIGAYDFQEVVDGGGVVDSSGSSINEYSARYTEMADEFYIPSQWRLQDHKNKQGSVLLGEVDHEAWSRNLREHCDFSMKFYRRMIENGIAREMARMVLPVNLYTQFYWTVNARALMNFIGLRSESHAQWEIRRYSDALWPIFVSEMPWTAAAFFDTLVAPLNERYPGIYGWSVRKKEEAVSSGR